MLDRSATEARRLERLLSRLAVSVDRSRILRPVLAEGWSLPTRVAAVQFSGPFWALELPGWHRATPFFKRPRERRRLVFENCIARIHTIKIVRAYGGCLGTGSR